LKRNLLIFAKNYDVKKEEREKVALKLLFLSLEFFSIELKQHG